MCGQDSRLPGQGNHDDVLQIALNSPGRRQILHAHTHTHTESHTHSHSHTHRVTHTQSQTQTRCIRPSGYTTLHRKPLPYIPTVLYHYYGWDGMNCTDLPCKPRLTVSYRCFLPTMQQVHATCLAKPTCLSLIPSSEKRCYGT